MKKIILCAVLCLNIIVNGQITQNPLDWSTKGNVITDTDFFGSKNNKDVWNPNVNPISSYYEYDYRDIRKMSFTFPQIIPKKSKGCVEDLIITVPITTSKDYQASNSITASSQINPNLNISFGANHTILEAGFFANGYQGVNFIASVNPCSDQGGKQNNEINNNELITVSEIDYILPILFPNPTSNYIFVEKIDNISSWRLVDIYGKVYAFDNVNPKESRLKIDLKNLNSGIYYFIAVMENESVFRRTIMKK